MDCLVYTNVSLTNFAWHWWITDNLIIVRYNLGYIKWSAVFSLECEGQGKVIVTVELQLKCGKEHTHTDKK